MKRSAWILFAIFASSNLAAQQKDVSAVDPTYRVTVVNGYGSGNFHAGDTVHVFANATSTDSVFAGWGASIKAIRFDDGREWHTTFVMLGTDMSVYAGFQPLVAGAPASEQIRGRDVMKPVWYAIPPKPRGIIIACHGTNGSGQTWFTNPEGRQFTRDAVANGFGCRRDGCGGSHHRRSERRPESCAG